MRFTCTLRGGASGRWDCRPLSGIRFFIFWITLPWFFSWMYFCNNGNPVWLAGFAAMFLICYHLTDRRIATIGSVSGLAIAWVLFRAIGPQTPGLSGAQLSTNIVIVAFCWFMALMLGISSSNLRREQLNYTLGTVGIMAHELRTPLAAPPSSSNYLSWANTMIAEFSSKTSRRP